MSKQANLLFVQVELSWAGDAFPSALQAQVSFREWHCLPEWLSGSLPLKSFLASSSPDPGEVIFTWSFCIQPSISEPDSLKTWNTTAILLCPVHSLIIVKLNHRWNLKGFIQSLSSKAASKESSEYLPHAVFIYSPKKNCLWSTNEVLNLIFRVCFVGCVKPEPVWADHGAALASVEGIITLVYSARMLALPSNFRDDWETNVVLFWNQRSQIQFFFYHCDPKAGVMLCLTTGKNSQEHRGWNSLSQEHELLVLHRCWGSLGAIWLICTNIKNSMKRLEPRWDLSLLNPRRKCWLWNNLNSPTNCFSGDGLHRSWFQGWLRALRRFLGGLIFCANLSQLLMQRVAGGGAGLLWNH